MGGIGLRMSNVAFGFQCIALDLVHCRGIENGIRHRLVLCYGFSAVFRAFVICLGRYSSLCLFDQIADGLAVVDLRATE